MAFTQADVDKLEAALVALNSGERVVKVAYADGSSTEFAQVDAAGLQAVLDRATAAVAAQSTTSQRSFHVSHRSKGL